MVSLISVSSTNLTKADEKSDWQKNAITAPVQGKLVGAGYIDIKFDGTLENASLALNLYGVMYKAIYNQISWTLVKKNIDQKRHIYVAATSSGNGHAVACFGYKVNNQKKYVYFWNPGTQSTSIVLYKTAGTTFSYNNSVWTWKYTAARNG